MDAMLERLKDPAQRKKIALELRTEHRGWDNLVCSTGWDRVMISSSAVPGCIGKTVAQLAQDRGVLPEELAFDLILEERGKTGMVFFHMCEKDVREILQLPETALISDTLYLPDAAPHPRAWGAQARLIGRCARDEGWMSLEQAVEKCTGLPARYFAIEGRGLLRPGYAADLVVFDPASILDRADYLNPVQPPRGIEWVFVNGRPAFHGGELLDTKAGGILLRGV